MSYVNQYPVLKEQRHFHTHELCYEVISGADRRLDLTASNTLCRFEESKHWLEQEVYGHLGKPRRFDLSHHRPSPGVNTAAALVEHAELPQVFQEYIMEDLSISIIDFDQAFKLSGRGNVSTPHAYCSPEVLLDQGASAASDVWALACCLFEIRGWLQLSNPEMKMHRMSSAKWCKFLESFQNHGGQNGTWSANNISTKVSNPEKTGKMALCWS